MDPSMVLDVAHESIWVFLKIATPLMLVALSVGLIISLFQALTQIQETTLSFVPKLVIICLFLLFYMPYIGENLEYLNSYLMDRVAGLE